MLLPNRIRYVFLFLQNGKFSRQKIALFYHPSENSTNPANFETFCIFFRISLKIKASIICCQAVYHLPEKGIANQA